MWKQTREERRRRRGITGSFKETSEERILRSKMRRGWAALKSEQRASGWRPGDRMMVRIEQIWKRTKCYKDEIVKGAQKKTIKER